MTSAEGVLSKKRRGNSKKQGFSLIEIIVAVGIFGLVSAAFASFAQGMFRELRAANQKVDMVSLQRDLDMISMVSPELCTQMAEGLNFNGARFTTSNLVEPVPVDLPQILAANNLPLAVPGQPLVGANSGLLVENTALEIQGVLASPNEHVYLASLFVSMSSDSLVRSLQPVRSRIFVVTDPLSPPNNRVIISCTTEPPPVMGEESLSGAIYVSSNRIENLQAGQEYLVLFMGVSNDRTGGRIQDCAGNLIFQTVDSGKTGRWTDEFHVGFITAPADGCIQTFIRQGAYNALYTLAVPLGPSTP